MDMQRNRCSMCIVVWWYKVLLHMMVGMHVCWYEGCEGCWEGHRHADRLGQAEEQAAVSQCKGAQDMRAHTAAMFLLLLLPPPFHPFLPSFLLPPSMSQSQTEPSSRMGITPSSYPSLPSSLPLNCSHKEARWFSFSKHEDERGRRWGRAKRSAHAHLTRHLSLPSRGG